ncbi:lipoprotein LpqH [Mycobacterium camsae]|uniref:lipoprotein LpqH n=1 Tax=Mycobacterium gordonae TaxID=1778 RepID=UPI0019802596|nr:lipoprotein LpqH [Mycobacterium gordonae]
MSAAFAAAVLVSSSLTGCTHDNGSPAIHRPTVNYSGGALAPTNDAKVTVDAQEHQVDGQIACTAFDDGETVIVIGKEPNAVKVTLTGNADSPKAKMVIMQNVGNYTTLYVMDPPENGDATVSKDGKNYTISGTSRGIKNGDEPVDNTPFRIALTCP